MLRLEAVIVLGSSVVGGELTKLSHVILFGQVIHIKTKQRAICQ